MCPLIPPLTVGDGGVIIFVKVKKAINNHPPPPSLGDTLFQVGGLLRGDIRTQTVKPVVTMVALYHLLPIVRAPTGTEHILTGRARG